MNGKAWMFVYRISLLFVYFFRCIEWKKCNRYLFNASSFVKAKVSAALIVQLSSKMVSNIVRIIHTVEQRTSSPFEVVKIASQPRNGDDGIGKQKRTQEWIRKDWWWCILTNITQSTNNIVSRHKVDKTCNSKQTDRQWVV